MERIPAAGAHAFDNQRKKLHAIRMVSKMVYPITLYGNNALARKLSMEKDLARKLSTAKSKLAFFSICVEILWLSATRRSKGFRLEYNPNTLVFQS